MKIHGELPLLSLSISDHRLQQVLSLVQSIPLPEGPPPEPKDEFKTVSLAKTACSHVFFREWLGRLFNLLTILLWMSSIL